MGVETILLATAVAGAATGAYQSYQQGKEAKKAEKRSDELMAAQKRTEERNRQQALMRITRRRGAVSATPTPSTLSLAMRNEGQMAGQKTLLGM